MAYGFNTTFGTGTTDRIDLPSIAQPTTQTISVWVYRHGAGGANFGTIWQTATNFHLLRIDSANTRMDLKFEWTGGGTSGQVSWSFPWATVDTWAHYLITYDGSNAANTPAAWLSGSSQTVTLRGPAGSGSFITTARASSLGNRASDNAVSWDGMIAEFARWSRIVTAGEIDALADGAAPLCFASGLVEYRPLVRGLGSPLFAAATSNGTPLVQPHPRIYYPDQGD